MNGYKCRPEPATHPDRTHSARVMAEIKLGHKVDPRYVDVVLQAIDAKFEIAEKMGNKFLRESAAEELAIVKAYQSRGTQAEILLKAGDQNRLAAIYLDAGQMDLACKASEKSNALIESWRAYQIEAKF